MSPSIQIKSLLIFVCVLVTRSVVNCYTMNDTNTLLKDKLADYNKSTRPTVNQSTPTVVSLVFGLTFIKDFDEVQQKLDIVAYLGLQWTDELMTWNPADYGGVTNFLTESGPFWTPNLILTNNAEKMEKIGDSWQTIRFAADGAALYYPLEVFTTICVADVTFYPWDVHYCFLNFIPQGYFPTEMFITTTASKVDTTVYIDNGAWELLDSRVRSDYSAYYSSVNIEFIFERQPRFAIINIILPIIFMAFLNVLVFVIPPDSGERISFSITVLLAISVFLTIVSDNLPKTSNPMSYFSYYLMAMLVTSICMTLCTIFNLRIYHSDDTTPVEGCWATIASCMRCNCLRIRRSETGCRKCKVERFKQTHHNGCIQHETIHHKKESHAREPDIYVHEPAVYLAETNPNPTVKDMSVAWESDSLTDSSDSDSDVTWKDVSVAFDKIFVIFFSLIIFAAKLVYVVLIFTSERQTRFP